MKIKSELTRLGDLEPGDLYSYSQPREERFFNSIPVMIRSNVPFTTFDEADRKVWQLWVVRTCEDCGAEEGERHEVACRATAPPASYEGGGWGEGEWEKWTVDELSGWKETMREPDDD